MWLSMQMHVIVNEVVFDEMCNKIIIYSKLQNHMWVYNTYTFNLNAEGQRSFACFCVLGTNYGEYL